MISPSEDRDLEVFLDLFNEPIVQLILTWLGGGTSVPASTS
jgi:hypothetical protein